MPNLNSIDAIEGAIRELGKQEIPDAVIIERIEASISSKASFIPVYTLNTLRKRIADIKSKIPVGEHAKIDIPDFGAPLQKLNHHVVIQEPSNESTETAITGENVDLYNHNNKTLSFPGVFKSVSIRRLVDCEVEVGPCKGPVFVNDCQDCCLKLSGHQIRISKSSNLVLNVFASASISLEDSSDIKIDDEVEWYSKYNEDMKTAGYGGKNNKYKNILDFTKL